jgi:dienelactone hydrolase
MRDRATTTQDEQLVEVEFDSVTLEGSLVVPPDAAGVVLFAHGSGSGRRSPRNRYVARELQQSGLATLLLDLLTEDEEAIDAQTRHLRFDIGLLGERLLGATDWLTRDARTQSLNIGYFGASTGAGAALLAAAERPELVCAIVSRGGRPDLAGDALARVLAPTLLIVGGADEVVIDMNRAALEQLVQAPTRLEIIPGATHLFEEPGTLEEAARSAASWLQHYLQRPGALSRPLPGEAEAASNL